MCEFFFFFNPHLDVLVLRLDGNLQKLQLMWQTMFVDLKSLMSWQYLMRDIHIIKTWNISMVTHSDNYISLDLRLDSTSNI